MNYYDHIPHLEELPLLEGNVGKDKLISLINHLYNHTAQITCKFDGAPSLVFGLDPDTKKFFVGTKSAFNKKPIRCFTNSEILDEYRDKRNKPFYSALQHLYSKLIKSYHNNGLSIIVQAELLWFSKLKDEYESTNKYIISKPNTIEYFFPKLEGIDLVIVPHTEISGDTIRSISTCMVEYLKQCGIGVIDPRMYYYPERGFKKDWNYLYNSPVFDFNPNDNFYKSQINQCIREGIGIKTILPNQYKWDLYCDMIYLKNWFYHQMNQRMLTCNPNILPILNNNGYYHEGFVISNGYYSAKIVDRYLFSRQNFLEKDAIYRKKSKTISQGSQSEL